MMKALSLSLLAAPVCALAVACGGDSPSDQVDAAPLIDTPPGGCDLATALPANYRPIPNVSSGTVAMSTMFPGTYLVDATAGGISGSADNPYIYLDLKAGVKVAINDLDARSSMAWDVALKRASLRVNGGDSGGG